MGGWHRDCYLANYCGEGSEEEEEEEGEEEKEEKVKEGLSW